jgi:AraC family transcriptional activator of pobA
VAYYATNLNITPKYLSEVLQVALGKPAKVFIDEFVVMEAKSLLKQTTMSIQEICHCLGFEDASHFTKSFKKLAKITPTEYRKR